MTFKEAVMAGPEPVRAMFKKGKLGIKGEHRWQIDCADTKRFSGSIDLDAAYAQTQPDSNRWDYGLGFCEQAGKEVAIWIEVHPAPTFAQARCTHENSNPQALICHGRKLP